MKRPKISGLPIGYKFKRVECCVCGRHVAANAIKRHMQKYHGGASTPQPDSQAGREVVAEHVLRDIDQRVQMGTEKYGTKLMSHNGRDALWDAYQEALDLVFYLRQAILEREGG